MTANANQPLLKVLLRKRVIVDDGLAFDAEREIELPIAPFVGLELFNAFWVPPGCDDPEDVIEMVGFNLKASRIECYLRMDDFRPEASGSDQWTEQDARERYRDWTLTQDDLGNPKNLGSETNGEL